MDDLLDARHALRPLWLPSLGLTLIACLPRRRSSR
jgi:hypothetical protein